MGAHVESQSHQGQLTTAPVGVFTHPIGLAHAAPEGHPERAQRLEAILGAIGGLREGITTQHQAPLAEVSDILRVHSAEHVETIERCCEHAGPGTYHLSMDTALNGYSWQASLRAAGAVMAGIDSVVDGVINSAFCAMRPPGHHAEHNRAMGFCLFNAVAIGAAHALEHHGMNRVAVVDIDVHHGNGTQDYASRTPAVCFASIHEGDIYPGTGRADEVGETGNLINAPLPAFTPRQEWREVFANRIIPAVEAFRPELILVSAGFDAHVADPLAQFMLEAEDFAWSARELKRLAERTCEGRLVSTLEGGYDLDALAASVSAYVSALSAESG